MNSILTARKILVADLGSSTNSLDGSSIACPIVEESDFTRHVFILFAAHVLGLASLVAMYLILRSNHAEFSSVAYNPSQLPKNLLITLARLLTRLSVFQSYDSRIDKINEAWFRIAPMMLRRCVQQLCRILDPEFFV